jgi:hypothetical protein
MTMLPQPWDEPNPLFLRLEDGRKYWALPLAVWREIFEVYRRWYGAN